MVDLVEVGLFGAAVAAVGVAIYSIRAGYRNQLRAMDRERRREGYASAIMAYRMVKLHWEGLKQIVDDGADLFGGILAVVSHKRSKASPDDNRIDFRVKTFMRLADVRALLDSSLVTKGISGLDSPQPELDMLLSAMGSMMGKLSESSEALDRTLGLVELSGAPSDVVEVANSISVRLLAEVRGVVDDPTKVSDWGWFDPEIEKLEALMKKDLDTAVGFRWSERRWWGRRARRGSTQRP
jgi:hypothetical protein